MFMVTAAWNDVLESTIQANWGKLLKSSTSDGQRSTDGEGSSSSANQADLQSGQTDVTTQGNAASRSTDQSGQADLP